MKDIKKNKLKNNIIRTMSVILILLSIVIYNPALTHYSPILMNKLYKINDFLKIDEITSFLKIDTIIPKAILDKDNNIEFIKMPNYKVVGDSSNDEIIIDIVHDQGKISDEFQVVSFIHKMSNEIINQNDVKKHKIVPINPENIEIAMNSIENINNKESRDYLFKELNKWRNKDFSNGVHLHNFVCHMFKGDTLIASSLNNSKINEILNTYFN